MSARSLWLESRRRGIGGSDAAAILGLDPWRSGLDVWISKTQPIPEPDEGERFLLKLGRLLEPVIAGLYTEQTGRELFVPEPEIVEHPDYPELIGTPDRLCPKDDRVIELKSEHQFADKFGDPGTDQVPDHYLIQCAQYMAICNLGRCDEAVLHGGAKFAIYQLRRDLDMERSMIEQLRAWWNDFVVKKVEPPLDASESWGNYLAHKYPFNRGPMVKVTHEDNPDLAIRLTNLLWLQDTAKELRSIVDESKNFIKKSLGENDGYFGPWGKITWRTCKDSTATVCNYEKAFLHLARYLQMTDELKNNLIDQFMETIVTKAGGRRFVAKRAKDIDPAVPELEKGESNVD